VAPVAVIAALALFLVALASPARAQGTARVLDLDPSIRSSGMGGASNAVFWGDDPNYWANPAMLGLFRGIRFDHGRTQLVPGLADDVFFVTNRTVIAGGGVGLLFAGGVPGGLGNLRLNYGRSEIVDPGGNVVGTLESFERIHATGWGVSAGTLLSSTVWRDPEARPTLLRHADVAFGTAEKTALVALAPGAYGGVAGSRACRDWGALVRAGLPLANGAGGGFPVRLDGSFGYSVINYNDVEFTFINEDAAVPPSRVYRRGGAARIAVDMPAAARAGLEDVRLGWLASGLDPLLAVGWASDYERIGAGDGPIDYDVRRWGLEITLANVLYLRHGHVEDRLGNIEGNTGGFGVNLPLGRLASFRWDRAHIPQARDADLPHVKRAGYSLSVDPVAIAMALRR
jgi:hypothetical protein